MDCANDYVAPGCAVDEGVIPSILSVLSNREDETDRAPFDELPTSSIHGDRNRIVSPTSSRVRLRSGRRRASSLSHPPDIAPSMTPDTEESSAISSTAGVINQAARSIYEETSGIVSRTREDMTALSWKLMNAVSVDDAAVGKRPSTQPQTYHSKSTASMTRTRIRKEDQATIVASSTFPPLSPLHNNSNNNHNNQQSPNKAMDMFSYSPNRSRKTISDSDHQIKLRQKDSILSKETSLPSRNTAKCEEEEDDDAYHSQSNNNNNNSHNLVHRIPLRDHSSPNSEQTLRMASSFASKQSEGAGSTHKILVTRSYEVKEHILESIFYVSTSAILGSIVRTYLARIFGMDCELDFVNDFLTPSSICVTNGGRTMQTGGALFYDFPANVLGSFILGLITPSENQPRSRFPWLHKDHALQRDDVFHASLGTGFCGCLTTFASWNTQMVVMLDGKYCQLGSQVMSVLFGYMIGFMGATCGFQFGRQCGLWMHNLRHSGEEEEEEEEVVASDEEQLFDENVTPLYRKSKEHNHHGIELVDDDEVKLKPVPNHLHKIPLFLVAAGFLAAFLVGNIVQDIQFYRGMTLLWFVAPLGSLLRWRLSGFNLSDGEVFCFHLPKWVPWGTFMANTLAAFIAALGTGIEDRYFSGSDPTKSSWSLGLSFAIISGFAGNLSTVSTMIKETVVLSEQNVGVAKAHYYAVGTCLCGMLLGIAVYSTTVRINT
jgi:fluoride exporter